MDIRKVKKLIELLEESGISEIEITEGEESVRISRHGPPGAVPPPAYAWTPPAPAAPQPPAAQPPAAFEPAPAAEPAEEEGYLVSAPMVGTFYAASSPGAPPFVQIGDRVQPGDTLCIIEAMKMMNQIESDKAGRVTAVLAKNGEPVEFGQPLFIIE